MDVWTRDGGEHRSVKVVAVVVVAVVAVVTVVQHALLMARTVLLVEGLRGGAAAVGELAPNLVALAVPALGVVVGLAAWWAVCIVGGFALRCALGALGRRRHSPA